VSAVPLRTLRQVASRLQSCVRQRTRLLNQFHQLLFLTFPELALLVKDISQGWVLELVHRYPSAERLATACADDLAAIPYLPHQHSAAGVRPRLGRLAAWSNQRSPGAGSDPTTPR
jgi:hypothetical protein